MNAPSQLLIQFGEQEVALDFPEQATLAAGNKAGVDIQIGDILEDGAIFFELRNLAGGEIQVRSAGVYLLLINEKEIEAEKYALPITLQMPELGLDCRLLLREGSLAYRQSQTCLKSQWKRPRWSNCHRFPVRSKPLKDNGADHDKAYLLKEKLWRPHSRPLYYSFCSESYS
jgi:hypothetical protein